MSEIKIYAVFLVTILLYGINCVKGSEKTEIKEGSFIYDTKQVELLMASIKELNEKLQKIEDRQDYHQKYIASKFNQLIERNNEEFKALRNHSDTMKIEVLNKIGEIDRKFHITAPEQALKETLPQLGDDGDEVHQTHHNWKTSELLKKVDDFGYTLNETKRSCVKSEEELVKVNEAAANASLLLNAIQSEFKRRFEEFKNEEKEKSDKIFNAIDELKGMKEGVDTLDSLQNCSSRLVQLMDWGRNQTKILKNLTSFSTCNEAVEANGQSGVYNIRKPGDDLTIFQAYCMKDPDEGTAWTLIQRRDKNSNNFISFVKSWTSYKQGFGDPHYDYWLGLQNIFALTNSARYELWYQERRRDGVVSNGYLDYFRIANKTENFAITQLGVRSGDYKLFNGCSQPPFLIKSNGVGFWYCGPNLNLDVEEYDQDVYTHIAIRPQDE